MATTQWGEQPRVHSPNQNNNHNNNHNNENDSGSRPRPAVQGLGLPPNTVFGHDVQRGSWIAGAHAPARGGGGWEAPQYASFPPPAPPTNPTTANAPARTNANASEPSAMMASTFEGAEGTAGSAAAGAGGVPSPAVTASFHPNPCRVLHLRLLRKHVVTASHDLGGGGAAATS
jgi:hypothetical protein